MAEGFQIYDKTSVLYLHCTWLNYPFTHKIKLQRAKDFSLFFNRREKENKGTGKIKFQASWCHIKSHRSASNLGWVLVLSPVHMTGCPGICTGLKLYGISLEFSVNECLWGTWWWPSEIYTFYRCPQLLHEVFVVQSTPRWPGYFLQNTNSRWPWIAGPRKPELKGKI